MPAWLAEHDGTGPARIGPLDPALSAGAYVYGKTRTEVTLDAAGVRRKRSGGS